MTTLRLSPLGIYPGPGGMPAAGTKARAGVPPGYGPRIAEKSGGLGRQDRRTSAQGGKDAECAQAEAERLRKLGEVEHKIAGFAIVPEEQRPGIRRAVEQRLGADRCWRAW